jgi:glycosyltransferase involved in cell wall biosynthesis
MRVLHVSAYYAPAFVYGGPPRSIHALCRALPAQGLDVTVFTTDANGRAALPASVVGGDSFEGVPVRYFHRSWPLSPIGSSALARAVRTELRSFDAVHVHGLWNRVVWAAAAEARRSGVPYVLSPRGMLEGAARAHRSWRKQLSYALFDRAVVEGASLLHATSDSEHDTLRQLLPRVPVALIPNGIDVPPPRPQRRQPPRTILFVGRVHAIKRLDLLVDAFALVRARHSDVRLVIAGPDEGRLRRALVARAGAHASAIDWTGAVDDTRRAMLLADAAALVMCSDSESFGMSVLEAMAASVPVVVTRTCPWADVHRHGSGFWIDQRADAVADALDRVLADPERARAMGSRGRALAESQYQWDVIAARFASQYRTLAGQAVASPAVQAT